MNDTESTKGFWDVERELRSHRDFIRARYVQRMPTGEFLVQIVLVNGEFFEYPLDVSTLNKTPAVDIALDIARKMPVTPSDIHQEKPLTSSI